MRLDALFATRVNGTGPLTEAWSPVYAPDPWGHFSVGRAMLSANLRVSAALFVNLNQGLSHSGIQDPVTSQASHTDLFSAVGLVRLG